jgi:hypothetical protein
VGLNISCKIVQKNPRLLTSLTISISQSNVLPLSKQRSPSLKARYFSPLFSSISIFLIISFSMCFLNFFFCGIFSLRVFFFFQIAQSWQIAHSFQIPHSQFLSNRIVFFSCSQFLFSLFSQFFFSFSSFRDFFFPNRTVFFFLTLRSYQLCFFLNFFFRSPLSDSFFFFQIAQFFFPHSQIRFFLFLSQFFVFVLLSQSFLIFFFF